MRELLEKLGNIESECCVTIILTTHRNKPDIQKDFIAVKNMITEAELKLSERYDKRLAQSITDRLKQLTDGIDHGRNLDGLILFVNEEIAEVVKIPVEVEERIVIGNTFATRELIRAVQLEEVFYILVLSRDKARLIEALNHQANEIGEPFPIENNDLYLTSNKALSKPKQKDLMIEEFFNRVDKALWSTISEKPHPVLICTEERNFAHYMKISDYKDKIIGKINQTQPDEKPGNLALLAWPFVLNYLNEKNEQRIAELYQAINNGRLISDSGEIWRALNEGRGQTLFLQKSISAPATVISNVAEMADGLGAFEEEDHAENLVDKMIEVNLKNGGDIVFLPDEDLKDFHGIALVTRF